MSVLEESPVHQTVSGHSDHRKRQSNFVTMGCCSLIAVAVAKSLDKKATLGRKGLFDLTVH